MKRYWGIFCYQVKRGWRWLVRKDVPTFLLFVGLAALIWWGRAMSSPRDAVLTFPIVFSDIPEQIVFEEPLPTHLHVTVRDNGRQLHQISQSRQELNISLASQLTQADGTIHLSAEQLRPKLQDMLPGSTAVQQIQPETISAAYHRQEEKVVPVQLQAQYAPASQFQMVGQPQMEPQEVHIYGKKQDLRGIHAVLTDSVLLQNLRDTVSYIVKLQAPANVRVSPNAVTVRFVAEQFTEKSFTLPVQVTGAGHDESLRLFPQDVTVCVRVGMSHFAEVNAEDFTAVCRFPKEEQASIPVEIEYHNPYVTNVRVTPNALEYIIER